MLIVVNTRFLLKHKLEGFGWFTYNTFKRIVVQHPEHQFIFLFDRKYNDEFIFADNVTPLVIPPQARHPILFKMWFNISVKKVLKKHKPDIFVSPDGYLCLTTDIPQLAVIHDLNFEYYPEDLPPSARRYLQTYFPKFAVKATRITTVSNYSKEDIVKLYKVASDKIDVIYNGVNDDFKPVDENIRQQSRNKYSEGQDYFITVGSLHPRKNIARLFQAFDIFKKRLNLPNKLIIAGEKYWWNKEMEEAYQSMEFGSDVIFTGHLEIEELNNIVGSAKAMVFVSYFEGFGIPAIEAMRCGTPLIASNVTSLPEVVGDAALLVNPFSVDEIADAMQHVVDDQLLCDDLIAKGKKRCQRFNWQNTAEGLWACIEKTVNH